MTTVTLPPRHKALRWTAVVVAVLAVGWLVAGYLVIGSPAMDRPATADAIVVLGSPTAQDRLTTARRLVDAGVSRNLVISLFAEDQPLTQQRYCAAPLGGFEVFCFRPDPATTRGEAEYVASLATQHGWHSIVVVTSTYHVSRARLIFQRCFDGRLQMVGTSHGMSVGKWAYEFLYQTGAYAKAVVQRDC
jgi:uncharacterized SAM-binding protein YcdF (DUF218 family)